MSFDLYRIKRTVIESNKFATTLADFCRNEVGNSNGNTIDRNTAEEWEGPVTKLLERLELLLPLDKKYSITTQQEWPKSAGSLSRKLKVIKSNLLKGLGFEIEFRRASTEEDIKKYSVTKGSSLVKIRKIASISSPYSWVNNKYGDKSNEDTSEVIQKSEDTHKISSLKTQELALKQKSEASEDADDNPRTSLVLNQNNPTISCIFCGYKDSIESGLVTHYLCKHGTDLSNLPIVVDSMEDRAKCVVDLTKKRLEKTKEKD